MIEFSIKEVLNVIKYSQFAKTDDVAYNIIKALEYCKENGEDGLIFDKNTYSAFNDKASQGIFSMSNHTDPGLKRACFLLQGFKNFTLDGNGSTFIMENVMSPIIISDCENVKVKGFSFLCKQTYNGQVKVIRSGDGWIDVVPEFGEFYVYGGDLFSGKKEGSYNPGDEECEYVKLRYFEESNPDHILKEGVGDYFFCSKEYAIDFSDNSDGSIKMTNLKRNIDVGQHLVFASMPRCCASIFINESKDTFVEDITLYSGIGMGVIAQNSENIDICSLSTRLSEGRSFSINADGTHFVHCKGLINVHDCFFEGQLDDALNVHSLYLKIADKIDNKLLLKYMHFEAKGIDVFREGGILQTSDPETLLPNGEYRIKSVKNINLDYVEVELEGDLSQIKVGDIADEISWAPDIVFENNIVQNNRARGMLLASRGKIVVRNNLFKTPGTAIKFESDGKYWFESGGTNDVLICNNKFDHCLTSWGKGIIEIQPRERTEENRYYHNKIEVRDNTFNNCVGIVCAMNNVETFVFKNNEVKNHIGEMFEIEHCKETITE